jgi:hypothetical protein
MEFAKGSEKQIAWAIKIKADWEKQIEANHAAMLQSHTRKPATPAMLAFAEKIYSDALTALGNVTDAVWLIDRRSWPITSSCESSIINALIPDLDERIVALPEVQERKAEESAKIEKARTEAVKALVVAQAEFDRVAAINAARVTEVAQELAELEAIAEAWTDEQMEGEWSEDMYRNLGRREQIYGYIDRDTVTVAANLRYAQSVVDRFAR